jgi:hypothetical protein
MNEFVLTLKTQHLTRVLKRLGRLEKNVNAVELAFGKGMLTLSLGGTSDDVEAEGTWPSTITVTRRWLSSLAQHPLVEPITDLRVRDGKLWARDFGVECTIAQESENTSSSKSEANTKGRSAVSRPSFPGAKS